MKKPVVIMYLIFQWLVIYTIFTFFENTTDVSKFEFKGSFLFITIVYTILLFRIIGKKEL